MFTDEYTGAVDQAVYFVQLDLITTPKKAGFQGRGVGVPLFSSPFVCLSFAPAPSTFASLKTIVLPGKLILRKELETGNRV
jgi:hypothetical protein